MRRDKSSHIAPKPTFAIIVDGECEVWYFQMLKRNERSLTINIRPEIPQKKWLEDQFEIVKKLSSDYDKVFWVIDLDVIIKESNEKLNGVKTPLNELTDYILKIETDRDYDNVIVVINTPCLEFWFLLHYKQTTSYYQNCNSVINLLKNHIPDYSKTQKFFTKQNNDIYLRLKPHIKTAIQNAKLTGKFKLNIPNKGLSEMYKFFETTKIQNMIFKN